MTKNNYNHIIHAEKGMALILVLGVIAILSFIMYDFTFEMKINKIKVFNQEDRFQARLTAEAGLNFGLAKLRLYQEGRNMIEKNEAIKGNFSSSDLESVIISPFRYPIPLSKNANIIQKTALQNFEKNALLKGEFTLTFNKISGLLNPNSLRIIPKAPSPQDQLPKKGMPPVTEEDDKKTKAKNKWESAKTIFLSTFERMIDDKKQNDEKFQAKYGNLQAEELINELIFYVNDLKNTQELGQDFIDVKAKFAQKELTPKHAPMASIEELHLLPSWDDQLIDMFKDRMSVHELSSIPINEMTSDDLKTLFPNITPIQSEEFFKYRDGDSDKKIQAKKFKNAEDFKSVVTGKLNIISPGDYDQRILDLKTAGLTIDTAGKLYRITSRGEYQNAVYTLVAIVDLPVKENKRPPPKAPPVSSASVDPDTKSKETKEGPVELLLPRVVEIRAE